MHQGDSGDGAAPSGYVVADESSCSGDLSFDDRDLGLNNQLASISYMLCTANVTRACSLNAPPLGYIPCGPHMPGTWTGPRGKRVCHVASTRDAAVDMRQLLRFPPDIDALLQRGAAHRSMMRNISGAAERFIGRCMRNETDCQTCGPYNDNPFKCAQNAIAKGARVNMIYAYGLRYHLKSKRKPEKPVCPLLRLHLAPEVERYSRYLMSRLHLEPGQYVAAQYRTGWAWRVHTGKMNQGWACYGMRTINASIAKLSMVDRLSTRGRSGISLTQRPLFLLTNERNLHDPSVPVPMQVLSEIRIVSLAHTVLLNSLSSFQDAVMQMRGGRHRMHFVSKRDVIPGDFCGCKAADENDRHKMVNMGRPKYELACANQSEFKRWIAKVKQAEEDSVRKTKHQRAEVEAARQANISTSSAVGAVGATRPVVAISAS